MCTTAVVVFSLLAQRSPQRADPRAKAQAQGLLTDGSVLYERGDYAGALEKFNAAYAAYLEITANVFWGLAGAAAVATGALFYWEGRRISVLPLAGGTTGIVAAVRY